MEPPIRSAAEANDALALLATDHAELKDLFARWEAEPSSTLASEICERLRAHTQTESDVFYAELERAGAAAQRVEEARATHERILAALQRGLDAGGGDGDGSSDFARALTAARQHMAHEEAELFPEARRLLGGALAELGVEMQASRGELRGSGGVG
jgi:hypothetical protein